MLRGPQESMLGLGRVAASAAPTLDATLQVPSLLGDPVVSSTQEGLVTDFRCAGQPILTTTTGFPWQMLSRDALVEGYRSIGFALDQSLVVSMVLALAAGGTTLGAVGVDKASGPITPVNELGARLNYAWGLGVNTVGLGADSTGFQATILRQTILGRFVVRPAANPEDITLRSLTVNNAEMFAGAAGAADEVPAEAFAFDNSDLDGTVLGYPTNVNDIIILVAHNYNAADRIVRAGGFCLPPEAAL